MYRVAMVFCLFLSVAVQASCDVPRYATTRMRERAGIATEAKPEPAREEVAEKTVVLIEEGPAEFDVLGRAGEIRAYILKTWPNCDRCVADSVAFGLAVARTEEWRTFCRVAAGETGNTWDPLARGDGGSSYGLWQINKPAHWRKFDFDLLSKGDAVGIAYQVQCAIRLRKSSGWGCWTWARNNGIR